MNLGAMETMEHMWVDTWCMPDWIIELSTLLWLTGMEYAKIRTHCKAQHGETGTYVLKAELKMDAGEIVKE